MLKRFSRELKSIIKKGGCDNIKGYSNVEEIFEDIRKCYKKGE